MLQFGSSIDKARLRTRWQQTGRDTS